MMMDCKFWTLDLSLNQSLLLFFRWFHVSCAVDSGLIEPCRPRDIKHNALCGESHEVTSTAVAPLTSVAPTTTASLPSLAVSSSFSSFDSLDKKKRVS